MKITAALGSLLAALVLYTLAVLAPAPASAESGIVHYAKGNARRGSTW